MEKNMVDSNNKKSHFSLTTQVYFLTFIGFFLSSLMGCLGSVIDGLIIGHTMSTADISASSVTAPIWFLASMTASLLAKGTQQLCSEKLGAGKLEEARNIYSVSVIMGFTINIISHISIIAYVSP